MSGVVGQQAVDGESGDRLQDRPPPAFVAGEALPLADSNLGVYLTLHTIFGRRSLPAPATLGSKDPIFLAVQRDIENLLSYTPEMMASAGGLDQQRNQRVSRLTCALALLSCKSALPGEMRYCHQLMQALLSARGDRVRTRPDETLGLGTAFEPDFLHLYRSAKGKFTDNSISGFFQAMLGSRTVPVRTDPELLRLMTIVCDCYSAKEASQLLNGLLRAHDKNPDAFARLANQGTIRTIIRKFPEHEIATVIKVTVVFIVRTALKDQADQLLQDMVENLSPDQLKRAAIRLANVLMCVREVNHELISSLLRTLKRPNAVHSFHELLGLLSQPSAVPQEPLSYDAQGIAAALYDRGLDPKVLAAFVQRSRRLSVSAKLYEQLIREIDVLQRLLEKQGDLPTQLGMLPAAGQPPAEWLLPLLQLGLVTYQGEQLDYLVKAVNVLSSDDFPAKDLALIIGRATEDLPRSLDLLAAPESSMESQTSGELGTALLTLWIKIEFLGQAQDGKMSAADLSQEAPAGQCSWLMSTRGERNVAWERYRPIRKKENRQQLS